MLFWLPGTRRRLLSDPKLLGRWGEKRCEHFLNRKGLKTVARNYSCKTGEIDLIMASEEGVIVFVEVKTRRDEGFAQAQDAVNHAKREKLDRTAKIFLKKFKVKDKPVRFDVVAVVLPEKGSEQIRYYENAFVP